MSLYADSDDLKRILNIALTDRTSDDELDRHLSAASDGLDEELGRWFGVTPEGETETFLYEVGSRRWSGVLSINDLVALTSVRVDPTGAGDWETWTLGEDFRLAPLNAETRRRPWTEIRTLSGTSFPSSDLAVVEVVGRFGWPAVPSQITEATLLLAEQLYQRQHQAALGFLHKGETVAYVIRNDPHIAGLVRRLSRRSGAVSAQLT